MGQAHSSFSEGALQMPLQSKFVVDALNNLSDDEFFWAQDEFYEAYPDAEYIPLEEQTSNMHDFAVEMKDILSVWRPPHIVRGTRAERPFFVFHPARPEPERSLAGSHIYYEETSTEYEYVYKGSSPHSAQTSVLDEEKMFKQLDDEFDNYNALATRANGDVVSGRSLQAQTSTAPSEHQGSSRQSSKRPLSFGDRWPGPTTQPEAQEGSFLMSSPFQAGLPILNENHESAFSQAPKPKLKGILKKHREPTVTPRSSTHNLKGILKPSRESASSSTSNAQSNRKPARKGDLNDEELDTESDTESDESETNTIASKVYRIDISRY